MNRKAKRNKYRNEIISKNVEINTLKNEVRGYTNAYYNALSDFRKCSRKLEEQEEKTEEYKKKYFDQLKKEFLEGNKELVTLSLAVPKDLTLLNSPIPIEELENLSFQLSFYYWTWSGAVRVPGVLKLSTTAIDFYSRCLNRRLELEEQKFATPGFI